MDVVKLNDTITEIENQAEVLKSTVKIYKEFENTLQEVSAGIETYENVGNDISKLKKEMEDSLEKQFKFLDNLDNKLDDIKSEMGKQINFLRQENKGAYKTLEEGLYSKLERHKSDIQVDIRNEGAQIERGLKNALDEKFISISKELENKFHDLKGTFEGGIRKQNKFLIVISIITILNLILCGLLFFMK